MECLFFSDFDQLSNSIILPQDEQKHLKVLRLKDGENIMISNGKGLIALSQVIYKNNEPILVPIEFYPYYGELENHISIAFCQIQARDRLEFLIEKAIELGVAEIIIIHCDFSQKFNLQPERIKNKAISAIKQSHRSILPQIRYEKSLEIFLSKINPNLTPILLDENGDNPLKETIRRDSIVFVGPEGGFSPEEMQIFGSMENLVRWKLGNRRLRTETAAIKAISILSAMFENNV
ncbi:MAG TPA: hypothetical protein DCW42_03295 [Bacteroidetes bacterium]|nr:hypothetical protein [Bacteroidota bacterium]